MSYFDEWNKLTEEQTDATFKDFWKEYSAAEEKIYTDILSSAEEGAEKLTLNGKFSELKDKYEISPVLLAGFLDGVNSSLDKEIDDLTKIDDDTMLDLVIDAEKLYFNMHAANAEHLYSLEAWDTVFSDDRRSEIATDYRRSRTVRKEKTPGRNDACPCGSGKKYKKCCGAAS